LAGLKLTGVAKTFVDPSGRTFEALKPQTLEIAAGECFSLLGPSGCGKTTLLRIIAGLERPDAGRIEMDGRDVTHLPPDRRPTAMVFQSYALFPHMTVEGNVGFGLRIRKRPAEEIRRKVDEVLRLVHLEGLNHRRMDELSGGQQQRVALARVLAVEPSILLMDEPLSNLDASLRRSTRSVIRRIQTELGLTLIYVTHDQEEALVISDRIALMQAGRILQVGTPRDLYERPATADVAMFLGQRDMIPAVIDAIEGERTALKPESGPSVIRVEATRVDGGLKAGDRVWLALKPDDIVLAPGVPGDGWSAEIVLSSFAGSNVEIEFRLNGSDRLYRAWRSARDAGEVPGRGASRISGYCPAPVCFMRESRIATASRRNRVEGVAAMAFGMTGIAPGARPRLRVYDPRLALLFAVLLGYVLWPILQVLVESVWVRGEGGRSSRGASLSSAVIGSTRSAASASQLRRCCWPGCSARRLRLSIFAWIFPPGRCSWGCRSCPSRCRRSWGCSRSGR
jgi:ABC-type Fe3+/spermidine/putrescine transport system ATPase subunit